MAQLNEEQVDIIHRRILSDGVTEEKLTQDLLDHYCCFIEEQIDKGIDFETAYSNAFRAITPNGMHEIQEEYYYQLTFKNRTGMKRLILASGTMAACMLTAGIILKYLTSPGSAALILGGIFIATLIFIPLVFALKMKEKQTVADKALWGIGSLFAIDMAYSVLFKVLHWPGANLLGIMAPAILLLLFLPVYFFNGFKNRDTRVNTVVTSVFIIVGCGLFFTLIVTPRSAHILDTRITKDYLRNERILKSEKKALEKSNVNTKGETAALDNRIFSICEELKSYLIKWGTGYDAIDDNFESRHIVIRDNSAMDLFSNNAVAGNKLHELREIALQYNSHAAQASLELLPVTSNIIDFNEPKVIYKTKNALDDLIQIQMILLQNQRGIAMAAL